MAARRSAQTKKVAATYRAASDLLDRLTLGDRINPQLTYKGKRNVSQAMGYIERILLRDYRTRYERSEVAERIVEAFPDATWRGGIEVVEDEDPKKETKFELAFTELAKRLQLWDVLRRADILAGLGRYAIVLIGAPGDFDAEMEMVKKPELLSYLNPFGEEDVAIRADSLIIDEHDPRYGLPEYYDVKRISGSNTTNNQFRRVHWTRILHICDGLLDERLYGKPRLRCVWNRLDDLEKVVGAGSEAYWQRVQPGYQMKVEKDVVLTPAMEADLSKEMDEFINGLRRYARTRAVDISPIGDSGVGNFDRQIDGILSLISAGCKIPKRILMGSEQAKLASTQDAGNWDQRVQDRRDQFASPQMIRPLVDRFIEYGVLPKPVQYDVRWPSIQDLNTTERVAMAVSLASANASQTQAGGNAIMTADEIRDHALDLEPMEPSQIPPLPQPVPRFGPPSPSDGNGPPPLKKPGIDPKSLAGKERPWMHVHRAADRFCGSGQAGLPWRIQRRAAGG